MKRASILLVDDHTSIQVTIGDALREHGYQVFVASSGTMALAACRQQHFDLALVDLRMPGAVDGLTLLAQLRHQYAQMALIVLTGYATLESAITALRQDADDFLIKPASLDQVRASVERALNRSRAEQHRHEILAKMEQLLQEYKDPTATPAPPQENAPKHATPRVWVDTKKRVGYFDTQFLALTPTEFDVLEYLIANNDRVVTARELVRAVHGYDVVEVDARPLIRVHIQRLRKKIRDDPARPQYILNVRGKGYRFIGGD